MAKYAGAILALDQRPAGGRARTVNSRCTPGVEAERTTKGCVGVESLPSLTKTGDDTARGSEEALSRLGRDIVVAGRPARSALLERSLADSARGIFLN